jgi:cytochrome d ubiquinol oxidase subunit I
VHLASGLLVGLAGVTSGFIVISANGWMNSPAGFDWINGKAINIDPVKAMFNAAWLSQSVHMTIAAFASTGFAVAGVHALMLLRKKMVEFHKKAFRIALAFGSVAALIQPLSGDFSAKDIAQRQPEKLAAMESLFKTTENAPLIIGGIPNTENEEVAMAIKLPGFLSFMAFGSFNAEVKGLDKFAKEDRPSVVITHFAFQVMVFCGMVMAAIAFLYLLFILRWRDKVDKNWWLKLVVFATPLGFIALETGWIVTEVGRQPWIIYRIMRTSEALTPMPGIIYPLILITAIYILLTFLSFYLMRRQIKYIHEN